MDRLQGNSSRLEMVIVMDKVKRGVRIALGFGWGSLAMSPYFCMQWLLLSKNRFGCACIDIEILV